LRSRRPWRRCLSRSPPTASSGAGGLGIPGVDAVRRICNAEDRRDLSALGRGEESALRLQRHVETATDGGVDAGQGEVDGAVQGRRRGHVQVGGQQAVRARRSVDVRKRELGSTYYDPRRKRLGAFSRRVEASA